MKIHPTPPAHAHAIPRHRPALSHTRHHAPEPRATPPAPRSGLLTTLLLWIAAAALLFEEWFWASSTRAIETLGRVLHLSPLAEWIRRRPPAQALSLFILPVLVIYPFKVLALMALAQGDVALGGVAFIAAKLAATAVFARLYELTEAALLHFRWIRGARRQFLRARAFVHAWLEARPAYRRARTLIRRRKADIVLRYRAAYRLQGRRHIMRMQAYSYRIKTSAGARSRARGHGARRR